MKKDTQSSKYLADKKEKHTFSKLSLGLTAIFGASMLSAEKTSSNVHAATASSTQHTDGSTDSKGSTLSFESNDGTKTPQSSDGKKGTADQGDKTKTDDASQAGKDKTDSKSDDSSKSDKDKTDPKTKDDTGKTKTDSSKDDQKQDDIKNAQQQISVHFIDENSNGEINHALNNKVDDKELHTVYGGNSSATTNNLTDQSIKYLQNLGYVLDKDATEGKTAHIAMTNYKPADQNFKTDALGNGYDSKTLKFDNDAVKDNQSFYVYLYHDVKEDKTNTESKTIDEEIKYVDKDNPQIELHAPYKSKEITFVRDAYVDQVTGKVVDWSNWSTDSFPAVDNPKIAGYRVDPDSATQKLNGISANLAKITNTQVEAIKKYSDTDAQSTINGLPKASHIAIVVPYVKDGQTNSSQSATSSSTPSTPSSSSSTTSSTPSIPANSTASDNKKPANSNKSTAPTKKPNKTNQNKKKGASNTQNGANTAAAGSNSAVNDSGSVPAGSTANSSTTPVLSGNSSNSTASNNSGVISGDLPQTGDKSNAKAGAFGLLLSSIASALGLATARKYKKN